MSNEPNPAWITDDSPAWELNLMTGKERVYFPSRGGQANDGYFIERKRKTIIITITKEQDYEMRKGGILLPSKGSQIANDLRYIAQTISRKHPEFDLQLHVK